MWQGTDDGFTLAFCSPSGQSLVQVYDPDQGRFVFADADQQHDEETPEKDRCPYGATPGMMVAATPLLPVLEQRPNTTRPSLLRARHARLLARPPLPARGPPMTA